MSSAALQLPGGAPLATAPSNKGFALLFAVPDDELAEYLDWAPEQKRFLDDTFDAIGAIHLAKNRKAEAAKIAERFRGIDGFSVKTLLNKHRLYSRGGYKSGVKRPENFYLAGDWKCLVPDYWLPEKKWPAGFLDFVAQVACEFQRAQGDAAAIRELKRRYEDGDPIPGYGTWKDEHRRRYKDEALPENCPPDFFPKGWSDRNLARLLPEEAHRTLMRLGVADAEEHFAQIAFDRSRLYFAQFVVIDDFWAPFKVSYKRSIDYCMGLAAIDWASGAWLHHAMMPRETLPDGKRASLSAKHMQWFVIGLLRKLGLPTGDHFITLIVENNSASITQDFELLLKQAFNGRVRIKRTGLLTDKDNHVLAHGFRESGGKWRGEGKGLIESGFNLLKNEMSGMPGQRGSKERTNGPATLADTEKYALALLKNEALSEADVAKLKLPFLTFADANAFTGKIFSRINDYRDHECQGYEMITEWRVRDRDNWTPYGTPATPEQQALMDQGAKILTRVKPESRAMRARKLRAQIEWLTIPDAAFIPLSAERYKPVTVSEKGTIKVERKGEPHWIFYSKDARLSGLLTPGREYRGFIFDEDGAAIVLTPKDSLETLGTVPRLRGVDPTDEDARAAAYAETAGAKRAIIAQVRETHAPKEAELAAMREHNDVVKRAAESGLTMAAVLEQAKQQNEQQSAAQKRRNARRSAQLGALAGQKLKHADEPVA
jgi:hypothetical protein